jgi:hypothetical protein
VVAPKEPCLFWRIDGKPLPIGACSQDRQAGHGRAAGGKAKGYKFNALIGSDGTVALWRVAPMHKDERVMAERLLKAAPPEVNGYLLADSNYDTNVTNWGGGLSGLPSWVRTHRRVRRWVQAKLVLTRRRREGASGDAEIRTRAA